jgi:Exo-beta-D-glucosaminidase Ig-fold domain/Concanavalin A-like lectin/glucanases superfamily/Glycosyl hydrolases family 2, sugar binding domain/Glycosyl hydrolases family 2
MSRGFYGNFALCALWASVAAWAALSWSAPALTPTALAPTANFGPYNVTFLEGGVGLARPLSEEAAPIASGAPWSITGWLRSTRRQSGEVIVAAIGDVAGGEWRGLMLVDGALSFVAGPAATVRSAAVPEADRWHAVAAVFDGGAAHLYLDGRELGAQPGSTVRVPPSLELAPAAGTDARPHFGGSLAQWTLVPAALDAAAVQSLARTRPDFSLVTFTAIGVGWPWQEHVWRGLQEPQDPWTLPHGNAPPSAAVASAAPTASTALRAKGDAVSGVENWHLIAAPALEASGETLSQPHYQERGWYPAVVPGTVLTTLIARGVYPDPDYGLNNLAIPDSLSRQDYWYRSVFSAPVSFRDRDLSLVFKGINYAAEVWLNGRRLGSIRGAFTRGRFDVTGILRAGENNAIAVRVAPPPHPGIPHEQSIAAGPGENGGAMAIDGPTFIASEGWDWIPGIRDRNTGIWQDVEIVATGALRLGDPHVVSHLPLPRTDTADISIVVPVDNSRAAAVPGRVVARFDGISIEKTVTFNPGTTEVTFNAAEFPQLHLTAPRLWWPNGYGAANLHLMKIQVETGRSVSDSTSLRFGIRELTYELSLFDHEGRLRRVEVDPTLGAIRGERLIDVRHEAIKRTPQGWAESLTPAGEDTPAVRPTSSESLTPYLVIRVNGVSIAARGGSWGMDDSRKRISRERLEPYFRLHRDAHLNIIRNWLGQNTEDVFYDLADEYGLLILNDFWVSTQDFQLEPQDPALFLANARDVISRYRNHPSIAVWFGRNEGVPQPILNEGLADLVATLDGTRHYTGSSNSVNLQGSGPYNYRPPEQYFTELARGFSVEVGTPSLATLESLRASIPAADSWPLSDTYAYHDWHFGGNGDVATFMAALAEQYTAGASLEDFERKAQLMNYVSYRAIFEGFQAHLWTQNSGRLLWMTHPSWPSNTWQIYSSDYDTGAAYYAVKKACEPVHAQLNLPDFSLAVINTTRTDQRQLVLRSRLVSLDGRLLGGRVDHLDATANAATTLAPLTELTHALVREGLVLVKLTLMDGGGILLSENTYWQGRTPADQRRLNQLKPQSVEMTAHGRESDLGAQVSVLLKNPGSVPILNAKITLLDETGARVLPAYYSDNYIALLAGEERELEIQCPAGRSRCARVALRGWNVKPLEIAIGTAASATRQ